MTPTWQEQNQRYLGAALEGLRGALQRHIAQRQGGEAPLPAAPPAAPPELSPPPAIETICAIFGLGAFERDLLLLCAGVELDSSFAALCATAQGDALRPYATFSLALAALPGAHWSALTPGAALRRWGLVDVGAGQALTSSPLRISERVLHYLVGVQQLDERLAGLVLAAQQESELAPSQIAVAEQLAASWSQASRRPPLPAIQLAGAERQGKLAVASAVCAKLGLKLYTLACELLPSPAADLEALARLWEREAALVGGALLLDGAALDSADPARSALVARFIDRVSGALFVSVRERVELASRPIVTVEVSRPTPDEQRAAWRSALGERSAQLNGAIDGLVTQFSLSTAAISAASLAASGQATDPAGLSAALWEACRAEARPRMEDLAQRIEPGAGWDDLVLPEGQIRTLHAIADQVRQRTRVYEQWGFAGRGARGLGISALFAGTSGTGKTLAAEVLAGALRLDLYRIDLSAVVSKYIGETEKNLRRIFDAAEVGGAILLFDEADALFGKRSEVKDSHDRYANIEVSYLLQRMESYRGLAVLTTNLKNSIDTAFLRRIRFVVQFPFPDPTMRRKIWERMFPAPMPREGLEAGQLAQLNLPGGNIKNIALNAAFLAAAADSPVRMSHIRRAAHSEYTKLEKTLTDAEVAGWADD